MIFSIEKGGAETYLYNVLDNLKEEISFHVICDHEGSAHTKLVDRCDDVSIIRMRNVFDMSIMRIAAYCRDEEMILYRPIF